MSQGRNLKQIHQQIYQKNKEILINAGIDPKNPPNPYQLIREEKEKDRKDNNKNKNLPYRWAREQTCGGDVQRDQVQQDPNASVTVARNDMSRQGFQREMNQSYSNYEINHSSFQSRNNNTNSMRQPGKFVSDPPNYGNNANNRFQAQNSVPNFSSNIQQSNNKFNGDWFDELWADEQSNSQPKNNPDYTKQSKNTYTNNNANQYTNSFNNNTSVNVFINFNNNQSSNNSINQFNNYTSNFNNYQSNNYSFAEQKPPTKSSRARDLFRKEEKPQVQPLAERHNFRKDIEKLEGLVECDKTKKLTTVKVLSAVETLSTRNYEIGDVKMWQINREYPDSVLKQALRNFPHVKEFKNNQKAIIKCALNGNDVFTCIPTGGGKSLIFQLMTFIKKGIYLCVLPLVSLIYDQQLQAQKYNIEAYSLTGATEGNKVKLIYSKISNYSPGQNSVLILCTPEKIAVSQSFVEILTNIYHKGYLQQVIIDEVHCVSTWGKQFRKEYENLSILKEFFPKIPILGLTATVTEKVKQEIIKKLRLRKCYFFQSSFNRPNLMYEVRPKARKSAIEEICKILSAHRNDSGIIYCLSKKECEEMCKNLNNRQFQTAFYHADLHDKDKRQVQHMWMENKIRIIIATIAFGMGINKPDVRFVIHNSLSKSLQGYYQESGRAGRDGEPAKCILFYQRSDRTALQAMILKNDYSSAAQKAFGIQQLSQMVKYCEEKYICRRQFQLNYLGQKDFDPANCNKTCDNCQKGLLSKEFQCINHCKEIVRFVQHIVEKKERITKAQLIGLLKGKDLRSLNKYHKAFTYGDLGRLQTMFKLWSNDHLQELLLQLLSCEVLKENAIVSQVKGIGKVTNIYIEYNQAKSKKFLDMVQTLPIRRVVRPDKPQRGSSIVNKPDFNWDDFFSDEDEKDGYGVESKETKSDFEDMNFTSSYEQQGFSHQNMNGFDFDQFQYDPGFEERQNQIRMENHMLSGTQNSYAQHLDDNDRPYSWDKSYEQREKVEVKHEQQEKPYKASDYILSLFDDDDQDVQI